MMNYDYSAYKQQYLHTNIVYRPIPNIYILYVS